MKTILYKKISIFLILLIYFSYFLGFYFNENSIGSGGYEGDLNWIWRNFEIYKNNSLLDSIKSDQFFGNRTPLMYIINIFFNPFIDDIYLYRISILLISLLGPLFFYLCLKIRFKNVENLYLLLISSIILLSPYYRTTAYWGMEINYSIISMLVTYYYYLKIDFTQKKIKLIYLINVIIFSSISIYFDQKFLFLPILIFYKILTSQIELKYKYFSTLFYSFLSIPYIFLFLLWGGIVPTLTQEENISTITNFGRLNLLHIEHIGYASTMTSFYLLPLIFFYKNFIKENIHNFYKSKFNVFGVILFFLYILYLKLNIDFQFYTLAKYSIYNFGLGITHKISIFFFNDILAREYFTYLCFFISWILILMLLNQKYQFLFFVIYIFFVSLFVFPIMQEYFDLIITISLILFLKKEINIDGFRVFLFIGYFIIFLIGCNIYYLNI
jgi:hypothetical protein